jgi:hypothetical protein
MPLMHPLRLRSVVLLVSLVALGWRAPAALAKEQTVKLKFRVAKEKDRLSLPLERKLILAEKGADLRLDKGQPLRCKFSDGERIKLDLDDSGRFQTVVDRDEVLALKTQLPSGEPQRHAIRMVNDVYGRPCLEPACARVGRLKGTPIGIVDANLNGRYWDYGTDMMVVGKTTYAFPLSQVVVVGRNAFRIDVAEDGARLTATPIEEPLGKLDFASKLKGPKGLRKPKLVVFRRKTETGHDHVAAFKSPALLPAGDWTLACAVFTEKLWAKGTKATVPVTVGADVVKWAWGAPFALAGKPVVRESGMQRNFAPPGLLKAPELTETRVQGKHIVFDFPPDVVGSAGVAFVGSWPHAGEDGVSLPDDRITHFDVVIAKDGKQVNTDMPHWTPFNVSGLVEKKPPYWTTFEWPVGNLRGTFTISFRSKSPRFGGELRSEPLEFEVK